MNILPITNLESRLTGETPYERVLKAVSLILESSNGEYRRVFMHFDRLPEGRKQLAERINPETGLMQEKYFLQRAQTELETAERYWKKTGKQLQNTYVLFMTEDVEKAKEHIKTNNIASTSMIGTVDGMTAALLPCDIKTAQQVMRRYDAVFVPYESETVQQLHIHALRIKIAKDPNSPHIDKVVASYMKTKAA
ncbi:hypothetical protein KY309_02795 [Candidatus Woesearchaeota archaeon]|nr:hypothetical protein [Candidatus Woesearchaeota archaeon]MBW3016513.1 hypothetical protein [Candidatus Woesearchaeota archaeon]